MRRKELESKEMRSKTTNLPAIIPTKSKDPYSISLSLNLTHTISQVCDHLMKIRLVILLDCRKKDLIMSQWGTELLLLIVVPLHPNVIIEVQAVSMPLLSLFSHRDQQRLCILKHDGWKHPWSLQKERSSLKLKQLRIINPHFFCKCETAVVSSLSDDLHIRVSKHSLMEFVRHCLTRVLDC